MDGLYVDSKKNATLVTTEKGGVQHRQVLLEKQAGKPGEYFLSHISTKSEKDGDIAKGIKDAIINTDLEHSLTVIGTDNTAATTGRYNGGN